VLLESVKQLKTPDTSFPTSQTESESANLELCFSKTWQESSLLRLETEIPFSNMSSKNWKDWVIEQRQEYSQRKKLAHLIRESESSSWPTATVFDTTGGSYPTEMVDGVYRSKHSQEPNSPWYGAKLKDAVETHEQNWATPNVCGNHNRKGASKTSGDGLSTQVKNWSTPTVMDTANIQKPRKKNPSGGQKPPLCQEVKNWQTPTTMDIERTPEGMRKRAEYRKSIGRKYVEGCLTEQVKNWPTATTRDWKDTNATVPPSRANPSKQTLGQRVAHVGLQDQANLNTNGKNQESWPTPRANKVHPEITEENREHLANRNKANLEEDIAGHCGKATGKLNPNWVEHLMGLPVGWTDLGSWETE
jgi:hypothetical protein